MHASMPMGLIVTGVGTMIGLSLLLLAWAVYRYFRRKSAGF